MAWGVAGIGRDDGGHQLDALGLCSGEREGAHGVVREDVGHAEGREAGGFGGLGLFDDALHAWSRGLRRR